MSMPTTNKIKAKECQKCLVHGLHMKIKGHKNECFYRDCTCSKCTVVNGKREKNKLVIAQKRRLELERSRQTENSINEDSDDGQLVIDEAPTEPTPAKTPDNKRAAYCRRCQVHGFKNLLRGHKDHCAFKGCWCNECRIITYAATSPSSCNLCQCGCHQPAPIIPPSLTRPYQSAPLSWVKPYPSASSGSFPLNPPLPNCTLPYRPQVNYMPQNSQYMAQVPLHFSPGNKMEYLSQASSQDSGISQ